MAVSVRWTTKADGDLAVGGDPAVLARRRAAVAPGPWTWLRQVHGAGVVRVAAPGEHAGAEADAAVTATPGAPIAVHTADCVPVLLLGDGAVGVVHAGWRGLAAGVIEAACAAMAALGAPATSVTCGPHIRARCYEFGAADLDAVAAACGDVVRSTTAWGTPALDLTAGVQATCDRLELPLHDTGHCTACSPVHHSHRARGEAGRQALVAWIEP
ncbi:MAG: laccase domain-containing protein [Acidimicrobiales bacterium]